MSMHHSLKIYPFKRTKRSVRKRYERMRSLMLQKKWDKEQNSIFALPKEKLMKKRLKKIKEEKIITPTETSI